MKHLLKYIFPILVALAFVGYGDRSSCDDSFLSDIEMALNKAVVSYDISESEPVPCLPRQISSSVNASIQGGARRIDNQQRHNFEFIKSGKIINSGVRYFTQNISGVINSSYFDPGQRLLSLGRLII